jgi:signal transduction histidine kinase
VQLNVLIVEDSEYDTKLILRELRRAGYEPNYTRVETPAEMQAALNRRIWDVIISDYTMPEFDGMSGLELLRSNGLDIPFIIVSGSILEAMAVEAMKKGVHDYLMKDNLSRLVPAIERELREGETRRARREADRALHLAYQELELRVKERTAELAETNERLRRALHSRDEFISIAAHELKTPVTSLHGFTQMLLRQFDKEELPDLDRMTRVLELMDQQSNRLMQLISQLMEFSRIETGQVTLERKLIDLVALAKEVTEAIQISTSAHQINVVGDSVMLALVDPLRIEQVLSNLVNNAVKYSPGGGLVQLEVARTDPSMARLSVTDQGIGIAAEHQSHIFERYYQVQDGDSGKGMGIGLYISRHFVELHGGQIVVESPTEGGTRFTVLLPLNNTDH